MIFRANDGLTGSELHVVPFDITGGFVTEPYGSGCGAQLGASGAARIGQSLAVELTASPNAPALLFFDTAAAYSPLGGGCTLYLGTSSFLFGLTTDANGEAQLPVSLGSSPSLVGVELFLQAAAVVVGGPYLGLVELSNGLEVIVGP